jgi:two-component system, NtrC family, nitrogen regulation sensor histidine kinase GlnL
MWRFLGTYEVRIKVFLILLVFFLASAITVNFYLLMMSRDAVREEVGQRIILVAEAARIELGLTEGTLRGEGSADRAPVSQARLSRLVKEHSLTGAELLSPQGIVLSSSLVGRTGVPDREYAQLGSSRRRTLEAGNNVLSDIRDSEGIAYATLTGFLPLMDVGGRVRAILKVEEPVGDLARLDRSLKVLAAIQATGLSCLVLLVLVFARWLLAPYRQLAATVEGAEGSLEVASRREMPDPNVLLKTFQGVVEKLRGQELELARLKADRSGMADEGFPAESLAKSLTSGMMAFDANGVLRLVNPAALQILGRSHAEMIGRRAEDLFGAGDGLGRLLAEGFRQAAPRSREMVPHHRPDGREIHLGVGLSPIRKEEGKLRGLICLLSDLTEIRQLRDRVALKENLAHLGEISAGIAHEFRNSLATLQGYARLLLRCREDETGDLARSILRETESIAKVVEEFLQYARPAALSLGAVDLQALLQGLAREMSEPSGVPPFDIHLTGELPRVVGDENLLRRAFHNLFLNASQARNGKGVEVTVLGTLEEKRTLRLEVADNGPGIPADVLPKIFTPFFTTRPDGTGLGLPLVQKAIVSHDGSIEVASQIGLGTRFVIRLPVTGPPEEPPRA